MIRETAIAMGGAHGSRLNQAARYRAAGPVELIRTEPLALLRRNYRMKSNPEIGFEWLPDLGAIRFRADRGDVPVVVGHCAQLIGWDGQSAFHGSQQVCWDHTNL